MKKIFNTIRLSVLGLALAAGTLTSCDDFLDTLPLNDVVLENFWTQKADVRSVLNSCYESLESSESIMRMGVWGELRSDNLVQGRSVNNDMADILRENILPNNAMNDWSVMYQTINRCNTVIYYAGQVHEKDPNYSYAEMLADKAEATTLRDLCYFYLIRTFRDVPISIDPSIDELQEYRIPATPMNEALDTLIADLESVKDNAVLRYIDESDMSASSASRDAYENSSRVTRIVVYSLLADLNLWRGNWDETIKYCDLVIDFKKQLYEDRKSNLGDQNDIGLFYGIPLILERPVGSTKCGAAYDAIFGEGNSFESVFELYFKDNQSVKNSYLSDYYGTPNQPLGQFAAPEQHRKDAAIGNCLLYKPNDCRVYETMEYTYAKYAITKYVNFSVSLENTNITDEKSLKLITSAANPEYSNWIIYRLTDIMLMKAEDLIMKGEEGFETAFLMINAVNKRARDLTTTSAKDTLVYDDYKASREKMETLLFQERNRELMFEGKRWYDLVRQSLRYGNTQRLVSEVTIKYKENVNAMKIKLSDPNIIFFPYHREELKVNPYLKQNPAFSDDEDFDF